MRHIFIKLIIAIPILSLSLKTANINAQESTTILKDTINLNEITIEQDRQTKITGTLSGKLTLHVEGVKGLPAIMGNTDLIKMLELTPGVQNSGDGNSNMYIRGGDAGQNLLLYNGSTIYSPGHILSFFPQFNIDHLSSVELSKGGVNAQYGGFISSAIAVKSKEDIPLKTSVRGNVGLLSTQAALELPVSDKWGIYASVRKTYLELLIKPLLNATINSRASEDINDMAYDFYDGNVTIVGKLSDKNKLVINGFTSEDRLDIDDEDIALNGYLKWKNTTLSAKLETVVTDGNTLEQFVTYSNFRNKLHTGQADMFINLLSTVEDIGYKNKLSFTIADIPFDGGLQYTYHKISPQNTKIENSGIVYRNESIGKYNAHDFSAFLTSTLRMYSRLFIEPGLRYNVFHSKTLRTNTSTTFHSMDFRLAGRYQLNSSTFLRANYSHNNQYINKLTPSSLGLPTDFWVTASDDIRPQKGDEYSVGYYKSISDGAFEFSSDVYLKKMKDVTEFNQNFLDNENIPFTDKIFFGKGIAYGIEFLLKKNTGKFTGWVSYTLGKSTRKFDEINNGKSFPAKYDRTHDLSIVGLYTINPRWDVSVVYVYATGNAYTQPSSWYFINNTPVKSYGKYNGVRMPDYNRTDLSVNYWFKKDNGLNFSIYNTFMVNNPIYVFMHVTTDKKTGEIKLDTKRKKLFTIIPSVSWRFKF